MKVNDQQKYLVAGLQRSPHLLFSYTEGENVVVLVTAFYETRAAHHGHVIGTKILKRTPVGGTALHPLLTQGLHQRVYPERLLLLVSLKVPGAQRHLTLQAGLHSWRRLIYAVVAEHLHPLLRLGPWLHVQQRCGGSVTLDDAAEFEVFLQGFNTLKLLAAFWAAWKCFIRVSGLPDAGSTVVVTTGENHRITEELEADGAAQLVG